jgi:hypothetical protein
MAVPQLPSSDPLSTMLRGMDPDVAWTMAEVPAVRVETIARNEEEADAPSGEVGGSGSAAGLVIGGAAIALGHLVAVGPRRRRPPLTAAFRPIVR